MKKTLIPFLFSILYFLFIVSTADAACSFPISGNGTIYSSCAITASTVDGVDAGTGTSNTATLSITGGAATTVTINASGKMAFGRSVTVARGSKIAVFRSSSMQPGPIWAPDADNDGYPTSANPTLVVQLTQPGSHVRRNVMTTLGTADCNDASSSLYQSLSSLYRDSDQDRYSTDATVYNNVCVGGITNTYFYTDVSNYKYLASANRLGTDCNDANASMNVCTYVSDTFTDTSGKLLTAHTMDTGNGWALFIDTNPMEAAGMDIENNSLTGLGRAIDLSSNGESYRTNDAAPSADYNVYVTMNRGNDADDYMILAGRIQDANNMYAAKFNTTDSKLYKRVSGTWTQIGSTGPGIGVPSIVKLVFSGSTITLKDDDSSIITTTDASISATGYSGIGMGAVITSTDDITLQELDNFGTAP